MKEIRYFFERFLLYMYFIMGITLFLTVVNAIFHYPEVYQFWGEPLSRLGGINTTLGTPNHQSAAIFGTGLQICSFICLCIGFAYIYWVRVIKPAKVPHMNSFPNLLFTILAFNMSIGALLLAVPYDHPRDAFLHALGTLLFILGFCIFNMVAQLHRRSRKIYDHELLTNKATFFEIFLIVLLFIMMIVYVVAFTLDRVNNYEITTYNYFNSITQKIVLIICLVAIFNLDPDDVLLPDLKYKHQEKSEE